MKEALLAALGGLMTLGAAGGPVSVPVPITCPEGTVLRGFLPPQGFEQWCEQGGSDGGVVRQGPYRAWQSNAAPFIEAEFCAGGRCGRYAEWYPNGRPKSLGEFDAAGRYQGRWMFWGEDGSSIEQDFADGELVKTTSIPGPGAAAAAASASPASLDGGVAQGPSTTVVMVDGNSPPPSDPGLPPQAGVGGSAFVQQRVMPSASVICPFGAIPGGDPFPLGLVQWCQKRDIYGRWVRHGILREWYPNGRKRSESDYVNGLTTGWVTRWFPNGQRAEETHYRNGVPDGRSARWAETGIFLGEELYENGARVHVLHGPQLRWPTAY